ncbi:hypothetical protein [Comamonas terrigena]|uniref:hypothetical protein n=1 Tax=Comamonas terrigena TaxID=32013 RepID=UPI00289B9B5C|nr:hypothetical protein [Comamonas terrigena]
MRHSYEFLLQALFARIAHLPRCSTLQGAYECLQTSWLRVNQEHESSRRMLHHVVTRSLCAEHGWQNLDGDPCRKESDHQPGVWVNLHRNGSIVFERVLPEGGSTILFAHPGTGVRMPKGPIVLSGTHSAW